MKAQTITAALAAIVMLGAVSTAQAVQNGNLVAHFRFDEEFGDTAADTAPAGTADNAVWVDSNLDGLAWGAGILGGAADMSGGGNDYFETGTITALDNATQLTIAGWINSDNPTVPYKGIFTTRTATTQINGAPVAGRNWGLAKWPDASVDARVGNLASADHVFIDNDGDEDPFEAGVWYHVAMTWDGAASLPGNQTGGQTKVYINGVLEGDSEVHNASLQIRPITELITASSWQIGEDTCCGGREWNGFLDDFGIWDIALSDGDVAQIYSQATGPSPLDLADMPAAEILPGDVNRDLVVSPADYEIIRTNFGQPIPANTSARGFGDLSGDGEVGIDDYLEWKSFFTGDPDPLSASTAVPEPAGFALIVFGVSCLAVNRSRKR